jgi:tRNA threonylcarbamoyladenosine biosynthesis protein TsaE
MQKVISKKIATDDSKFTEKIGELIGKKLKGNEIINLVSDLGGGKTTFVRGLLRGAGSSDLVSSPTFTLKNVYSAKDFEIWHFDFYRIDDPGMVGYELEEALDNKEQVIVIEWAKDIENILPKDRMTIKINPTKDDKREMFITVSPSLEYLVSEL